MGESMTVKAIYENGVFKPVSAVHLPEKTPVEVILPGEAADEAERTGGEAGRKAIMEILSRRFRSGRTDVAERHNEHQP
jgi:predicted DNA-binding antitoxin AbrB/MazE fold protein